MTSLYSVVGGIAHQPFVNVVQHIGAPQNQHQCIWLVGFFEYSGNHLSDNRQKLSFERRVRWKRA